MKVFVAKYGRAYAGGLAVVAATSKEEADEIMAAQVRGNCWMPCEEAIELKTTARFPLVLYLDYYAE